MLNENGKAKGRVIKENYKEPPIKPVSHRKPNGNGIAQGWKIMKDHKELNITWVGRRYKGLESYKKDAEAGICGTQPYQYGSEQYNDRWFSIEDFIKYYKQSPETLEKQAKASRKNTGSRPRKG